MGLCPGYFGAIGARSPTEINLDLMACREIALTSRQFLVRLVRMKPAHALLSIMEVSIAELGTTIKPW